MIGDYRYTKLVTKLRTSISEMSLGDLAVITFEGMVVLMVAYVFLIFVINAYASSKCLEKGYPEATTTVFLDSYCVGIDGVAKTIVVKP